MFENLKSKIALVKIKLENKRLEKKKCITYNGEYRKDTLQVTDAMIEAMLEARKDGNIDEDIILIRNLLAKLNGKLASSVLGFDEDYVKRGEKKLVTTHEWGNSYECDVAYSSVAAKMSVKTKLDAGADVKGLFYPVFEDDDPDELARISINCLTKGVRLWPLFLDNEMKKDWDIEEIDPVYVNLDELYNQLFSIGELATLHPYKVEPDIIAMLMRADGDFMVRRNENPKGDHALAVAFYPETQLTSFKKKEILDAYQEVYNNKENMLSSEQRESIVDVLKNCVNKEHRYSQNIADEDKAMIMEILKEMKPDFQKTTEIEK